ncbi:MAG: hypothetical protein QME59_03955, partial [Candidatus Hydrothermarchaeota archaeon]|nr:hypothetical protein [Candidatus Hydrothermarchaeota archaeon]
AISFLIAERTVENPSQFFKEFLSKQSENFDKYKLLWDRASELPSGEEAFEWSFKFVNGSYHFIAVSVQAIKRNRIFHLDGSCLEEQFKDLEHTLLKVIKSLSLF